MTSPCIRFLPCLALIASALPALAAPTVTYMSLQDRNERTNLDYELHFVEVSGLERSVQEKVNSQLLELVLASRRATIQELESDPELGSSGDPGANSLEVGTGVGALTDDLLSVSFSVSSFFKGMLYPRLALSALTFDLRPGEPVESDRFFVGKQRVIAPVARKLRTQFNGELPHALVGRPTVDDIQDVVVEPEGMTFLWGVGGLGAPHAAGPIVVSLTWTELGDTVDRDGILRSAILLDPNRPSVDIGLGEDFDGSDPDAPVTLDNPTELYLMGLTDQLQGVFATLTVEERLALRRSEDWGKSKTSAKLLGELEGLGLTSLAKRIRAARATLRGHYDASVYAGLGVEEFMGMASELDYALEVIVSGRVITQGSDLLVRGMSSSPDAWGDPIARVPNGAVVGVLARAGDRQFHTVMLADGTFGRVHKNYLLLETPVVDGRGRVIRMSEGLYVFGSEAGPQLIAKEGPGRPDAQLAALTALVEGDESPPVNLIAIEREIGQRPAWLAVVEFTDLSNVDQLGEGQPAEGLADKLPE